MNKTLSTLDINRYALGQEVRMVEADYIPTIIKRLCADWDDWDECDGSSGPLLVVTNAQLMVDIGTHKRGDYVDELVIDPYDTEITLVKHGVTEKVEFTPRILTEDEF